MTDVSEAEVEAAGQTLRERNMAGRITRAWTDLPMSDKRKWLNMARAALTAAAQVRAGNELARIGQEVRDMVRGQANVGVYPAIEPDSGPSVLGIKRGGE